MTATPTRSRTGTAPVAGWLNRQRAQDALLAPVAEILFDRDAARPCVRHRRVLADAGASAPACAERAAGRLRPRRRYSLPIRAWPRRSALLAFRRDVLR